MSKQFLPYISFSIWREFEPAIGSEKYHCDMKRGFFRAKKNEEPVKALLAEEKDILKIGHWVQKGIYELHQDLALLGNSLGIDILKNNLTFNKRDRQNQVIKVLKFIDETPELQEKVIDILKLYKEKPILQNKEIIEFSPGDEGIPKAILMQEGDYKFNLFAAFDCVIEEDDKTLHILDLKTGKSDFDRRQGYVYILAASRLYPGKHCTASFYNVETEKESEILSLTPIQLNAFNMELAKIAKLHQEQLQEYRYNKRLFSRIYPSKPGLHCHRCEFNSICHFAVIE